MQINEFQLDGIRETLNIAMARAAASLSEIVCSRVEIGVPLAQVLDVNELDEAAKRFLSYRTSVSQAFCGEICGRALLLFTPEASRSLVRLLCGQTTEVEAVDIDGVLTEVGNIVLNGLLGSLANLLETRLMLEIPVFKDGVDVTSKETLERAGGHDSSEHVLVADISFNVAEHRIEGTFVMMLKVGGLKRIISALEAYQMALVAV